MELMGKWLYEIESRKKVEGANYASISRRVMDVREQAIR